VRDLLVYGGFDLGEEQVHLETAAGDRRRIDISVGAVVIECERDLGSRFLRNEGTSQLSDYLKRKEATEGHPYAGVLTDLSLTQIVAWT